MKKEITEFIGTFFLVLSVGMTGDPLTIGATLMVMVYMGRHISGAHYNPAVTLAMLLDKQMSAKEAGFYIIAQLLAAIFASAVVLWMAGATFALAPNSEYLGAAPYVAEILGSFALVLVIFNVEISKETKGNSFYGLAIGFVFFAAVSMLGGISGGAFNPAVGIGPWFLDMIEGEGVSPILIYIIAPIIGGLIAKVVFRLQED